MKKTSELVIKTKTQRHSSKRIYIFLVKKNVVTWTWTLLMLRLAGKKMKSNFSRIDSHHFGPNKRKHNKPKTHPITLCIILKSETAQKWNVASASNSKTNLKLSFLFLTFEKQKKMKRKHSKIQNKCILGDPPKKY